MFTGPNAGAPDPSITVTSRISSDPNGPACSGALALCALAFVAAIAAPTPNNTATTVFIVLLDLPRSLPGQQTRKANFMAWRSPAQIHTPWVPTILSGARGNSSPTSYRDSPWCHRDGTPSPASFDRIAGCDCQNATEHGICRPLDNLQRSETPSLQAMIACITILSA